MGEKPIKQQFRGTAIIETSDGILMNAMNRGKFLLPGGAAKRRKGESRIEAVVREVREEMGIHAFCAVELFLYEPGPHPKLNFQDHHRVFYVRARGIPKPRHEVKHIGWYRPGMTEIDGRGISGIHIKIIERWCTGDP